MFAISEYEEEMYSGQFETLAEAIDEAVNGHSYESFWVGECVSPQQPEEWWEAEDWLEHVSCQDEYSGEWAEDWDNSTKTQRQELEDQVQKVMAAWLDKYDLRPKFFNVKKPEKYVVIDGIAVKFADVAVRKADEA